jgi:hypothetical protein
MMAQMTGKKQRQSITGTGEIGRFLYKISPELVIGNKKTLLLSLLQFMGIAVQ